MTEIPFVDLTIQARELREDYERAFSSVLERGAYTLGPELAEFEQAFAQFCGVEQCVGVSSGTDAVKLALLGAGVQAGDEVILPVNTFIATAEAVSHVGAKPVFADCLPDTAEVDAAKMEAAVTGRTKALLPVHLYGQPVDWAAVEDVARRHGLAVVEDACQAHGARYRGRPCGSLGVTAAFSFYPSKNLGALGDGGAVTTQSAEIAERLRRYRNHGQVDKETHAVVGYCDRLHNLQAAFLLVKLPHLAAWNRARRAAARRYDELLAGVEGASPLAGVDGAVPLAGVDGASPLACRGDAEAVYHLYVVQVRDRDRVRRHLQEAGVRTGIHYPVPLHLQPAYAHLGYQRGDFPIAEKMAGCILSLPMFPEITAEQQDCVVERLTAALA